ncbi:MAG: hypothetical protein M1569_03715, partial [Candidatus Marsarchaeota archaeon]|nr:hypothetical protein [Candidatus Marsarchaeota archaeon]
MSNMISAYEIQIAVLVLVGLAYALFDVLNDRNVPNGFVYLTLVIGIAGAFAFNYSNISIDLSLAVAVGAGGFLFYRSGLLGGGDVAEFVFISLLMPLQKNQVYLGTYQFPVPFILSVLMAAVFAALIYIPVYYLVIRGRGKKWIVPSAKNKRSAALMLLSYTIFIIVLWIALNISAAGVVFVAVLAGASVLIVLFESQVYRGMVTFVYPNELEEGDMIAVNLMSKADISYFKRRSGFG